MRGEIGHESIPLREIDAARQILRSQRLSLTEFSEVFSAEKLREDIALVAERRAAFVVSKERDKERGEIAEATMIVGVNTGKWFGQDTSVLPTTEFDDFEHGVDILLERMQSGGTFSHFALGVDVSVSEIDIEKKLQNTTDRLRRGQLTKLDYFYSPRMGLKGQLLDIPHGVVGVQRESLMELSHFLPGADKEKWANLIEQFIVLEELKVQLTSFVGYIKTSVSSVVTSERKQKMFEKYTQALAYIEQVLQEKQQLKEELFVDDRDYKKVLEADRVYKAIFEASQRIHPSVPPKRLPASRRR